MVAVRYYGRDILRHATQLSRSAGEGGIVTEVPGLAVYDKATNLEIVGYLRSSAIPHTGADGIEYGGWELMTHPDLYEAFAEVVGSTSALVPIFGRAAVIEHDVIVAVALGTSWLMFRLASAPAGVEMNTPVAELEGSSWYAVSAWQPDADSRERLKGILRDARDFASI